MKIKINLMVLIVFILNLFTSILLTWISGGGVSEYLQIYITQLIPIFLPSLIYFLYNKNENNFDKVKYFTGYITNNINKHLYKYI